MKKFLAIALAALMLATVTACTAPVDEEVVDGEVEAEAEVDADAEVEAEAELEAAE